MPLTTMLLTTAAIAAAEEGGSSISHPAAVRHSGGQYTLTNVSDTLP